MRYVRTGIYVCDRKLRYSKFRHLRNNPKTNKTNILLFFLLKTYFPVMNLLIACRHYKYRRSTGILRYKLKLKKERNKKYENT